jgi:multiple sugar transport system permease protein
MERRIRACDPLSKLLQSSKEHHLRKKLRFLGPLLRFFLLLGIGYSLVYPLLFLVSTSFKPVVQNYDPSVIWIPRSVTMKNIYDAIKILDYWNALETTLRVGLVSALLQIVATVLVGYGFARFRFRLRGLLFVLVVLTIIVPPQTIAIPTYVMFRNFDLYGLLRIVGGITGGSGAINLINSPFAFYLPAILGMGLRSGVFIFVFRQFFRGMPKELEDAAAIDGCGFLQTFLRVMLPNAGAAMLTVFLFTTVWYWNDYYTPSMIMSTDWTLSVALAGLKANLSKLPEIGASMDTYLLTTRIQAGCLLCIAPLLAIYVFAQKYFTESIERTGIVG